MPLTARTRQFQLEIPMSNLLIFAVIVGGGATLIGDLWGVVLKRVFGVARPNWGMAGRWLKGLPEGRLKRDTSDSRTPSQAEHALGWAFHYAVGIVFAALLPLIWGMGYMQAPSLGPALVIGLGLATFCGTCIFMPAMGAGLAGAALPNRQAVIGRLLLSHLIFGLSLWLIARALA